jgi:hypothetical protein
MIGIAKLLDVLTPLTPIMHLRIAATLFVSAFLVSCSADSAAGPGPRQPLTPRTLALTSVSGTHIPAVYFTDTADVYRSWADSGTATLQADKVIAFHLYESATSTLNGPHKDQTSDTYAMVGNLTSDSTFEIDYTNSTPDYGTINQDGSITVNLTGLADDGAVVPFGKWLFATAYHGVALNPTPVVDSIAPTSVPIDSRDTTVLINGSSFTPNSTASLNGSEIPTTYVSAAQLRVSIPSWLLSTAGVFQIVVTNHAPGGGTYHYPFAVTRPAPTITALAPNTVAAGSLFDGITVEGTGFDGNTVVTLNGVTRTPDVGVTSTSLHVRIDAADIAAPGIIQVAVAEPPPGGGTSASVPFTVTGTGFRVTSETVAPTAATLLVSDPVLPVVYAGLDATDRSHPNSIAALDGATGRALWSVPADGPPATLAVSSDGQFLYFTTHSDSAIYRITIATASISLVTPVAPITSCSMASHGILVSPDNPHTIAVEWDCKSGIGGGVTIYDDSVAGPRSVYIDGWSPQIFSYGESGSVLYGFGGSAFIDVTVDGSGATASAPLSNAATAGNGPEILYVQGKLYATTGTVYDPVARAQVNRLPKYPPAVYSIAASHDGQTLFVLTSGQQTLVAFDLTHGTPIGQVAVPGPVTARRHLVRWGTDGIAFISGDTYAGGNIYLIRSDLVH